MQQKGNDKNGNKKGLELQINKMTHNQSMPTPPSTDIKPNSYDLNKKHLTLT